VSSRLPGKNVGVPQFQTHVRGFLTVLAIGIAFIVAGTALVTALGPSELETILSIIGFAGITDSLVVLGLQNPRFLRPIPIILAYAVLLVSIIGVFLSISTSILNASHSVVGSIGIIMFLVTLLASAAMGGRVLKLAFGR
jgi:hypothetical protein